MSFYENNSDMGWEQAGEEMLPDSNITEQEEILSESEEAPQEEPKSKRRKKAKEQAAEDGYADAESQEFYDDDDADAFDEDEISEQDDDASSESENGHLAGRRRRSGAVLDGEGRVIQDRNTDNGQYELSVLAAARNSRRIMSSTLDGFEADGESMPKAVFYLGPVKVMIPFTEMGLELGEDDADHIEARIRISGMLGAKIFYMVRGIDVENRLAVASRRGAMIMRRRTILNARNDNGLFRVREGMHCMAQVLQVGRGYVRMEVYGMETYLHIGDISNLWINDIREVVKVGEEHEVEVVELTRDDDGNATALRVSMKLAEKAPLVELQVNQTYTGNISGFSNSAYFVKINGVPREIRCPIRSNHVGELMEQGDFVKLYVRAIYDGAPTGAISKLLKKAEKPTFR